MGTAHKLEFKSNALWKAIASKKAAKIIRIKFKKNLIADGTPALKQMKSKERPLRTIFFIQVTYNMNAKGQTWKEKTRTVTRSIEKNSS